MPYVSDRQRRYFHAQKGKKIPADVVDEYDDEERKEDPRTKRKRRVNAEFLRRMACRPERDEE